MKTVIYYYSATGNSLYVARRLQEELGNVELRSIAKALQEGDVSVEAECVGIVFPMHYFGLPMQVEDFLKRLVLREATYLFAVSTCGVPYWGMPFIQANEILIEKGRKLHGQWFLRLVSNYIPLRDIAADWRISIRAWLAEKKLKKIASAVASREGHETWQLLRGMSIHYHEEWKSRQVAIDEKYICDIDRCTSCGMCEKICPTGNILRPEGNPQWQHKCVECLGCLHICPVKAIDYGEETRGRKRYRHKKIQPRDLVGRREENRL